MATVPVPDTLDVLSKFEALMKESVSSESVYIRTKETIGQYFKDSSLNSADKASAIANILGGMASSITGAAMQTALQWSSGERDLALRKLQLAKELEALDADIGIKVAQSEKLYYDNIAVQAETLRMLGAPLVVNKKVTGLSDSGKVWQDIKLAEQQEVNMQKEATLLDSKLKESYAAIHRSVADTVVNFGPWNYNLTETGISTVPTRVTTNITPLSDIQRIVAEEQSKGYSYNAWANAVTSSAGMIGTAMASDFDIPADLLSTFQSIIVKLRDVPEPIIP